MAHPYTTSQGGLVQVITQFRSSFPASVDAKTLKKLGFAPNNESYILNVLRFLGLLDDEGKKTPEATKVFNTHGGAFAAAFAPVVSVAYEDLFALHRDATWDLDSDALISFFRANDGTSDIVGKRQASTFQTLSAFAGHGEVPEPKPTGARAHKAGPAKAKAKQSSQPANVPEKQTIVDSEGSAPVGLTVRIEVNLPADGDQATYDRIFKSIRENLLNG